MSEGVLKEWKVDSIGEPGQVTVQRREEDIVVVWICGASRHFAPADLKSALERFDLVMSNDGTGDLWYGDRDTGERRYHARLDNGNFMADENASDGAYKVPWDEFSKALHAALPKPRQRGVRKAKKT